MRRSLRSGPHPGPRPAERGAPAHRDAIELAGAQLIDALVAFRVACHEAGAQAPSRYLMRQVRKEAEDLLDLCHVRYGA